MVDGSRSKKVMRVCEDTRCRQYQLLATCESMTISRRMTSERECVVCWDDRNEREVERPAEEVDIARISPGVDWYSV